MYTPLKDTGCPSTRECDENNIASKCRAYKTKNKHKKHHMKKYFISEWLK